MSSHAGRVLLAIAVAAVVLWGDTVAARQPASRALKSPVATHPVTAPRGLVTDWSQRHVVVADPDTPEVAARKGRTAQWRRDYQDPRFVAALARKLERQAFAGDEGRVKIPESRMKPPKREPAIHRDWSHVLGGGPDGGTGRGNEGMYAAKFSFDISAAPSCTADFVVYPTRGGSASSSPTVIETWVAQFTGGNTNSVGSLLINRPGTVRDVSITSSASPTTPDQFQQAGTPQQRATALVAAVNRWAHQTGFTAAVTGAGSDTITISNNTAGGVTDSFVTHTLTNLGATFGGVNGSGTAGQATIIAFNQLYAPCLGASPPKPQVLFAYNTGAGAIARTSPVLSYYDGATQVAFIQSSANAAQLVLLKWSGASPGTAGMPTDLTGGATNVAPASYRACTAPCMTVLPLNGGADNTFSSPFVNYSNDTLWVGDNAGVLHKFTNVFRSGTPTEVVTGGFPATVSAGNALSPPVYDFANAQVFVGSGSLVGSGGRLHRVDATNGTVTSSAKLTADTTNPGVRSSPMVDASNGRAYAFVFNDGGTGCSGFACSAVVQFDTAFAAGNAGTKAPVGRGSDNNARLWSGTFDEAYWASPSGTGAMYVCGTTTASALDVVLWKIPFVNNAMGTPEQGTRIGNPVSGSCAPVSSVKNGANEFLFVSVPDNGVATGCTGACIYAVNLVDLNGPAAGTGAAWASTNAAAAGLGTMNGASGVIVDNISAQPGASQVYFTNIGTAANPGNAIQASQAGLQ